MTADTPDLYDRLLAEARVGCWCGDRRKPCSYHEGYADGLEVMETALAVPKDWPLVISAALIESVPWSDAIGRVAAKGTRSKGWTITSVTPSSASCDNGMAFFHDGTIEVLPRPAPVSAAPDHSFVGVAGHSDDNECTHRSDGTDDTYCGLTIEDHEPSS